MRIEKTKRTVKNIVFGFVNRLVAILFPFAIKTIIIYKLGVQYLGLNSLFAAILNVLNFAEIGFGTAITFSMYKPIAEDDQDTLCALLNLYKKIYRICGLVVVAGGLAVMPFLPYLIKGGYPADINLYLLYAIYLFNNVAGYFFFAYRSSLFAAYQRNDILSIVQTATNCLCYAFQVLVLFVFPNYYVYIIFTPIATILNNLIIGWISKKAFPQIFERGKVSPELAKEIKAKVYGLLCHKVGSVMQSSIDNIAISAFFGLTILGVYNNYLYLQSAVQSFITIIFTSLTAGIGNNIYQDSVENNYRLFMHLHYACIMVVAFCTSCLLTLYQPFMVIWDQTNAPLNFSVVILLCVLFYVNLARNACGVYREAIGTWDKDKLRPLCITLVNLVGTLISAALGSIEGVVVSTIVAYLVVSYYWEAQVLYKIYFKRSKKEYFVKLLVNTLIATAVCVAVYFLTNLIPGTGIKWFVVKAIVCAVTTLILLLVGTAWEKESRYWFNKLKIKQRSKPHGESIREKN